MIYVDSSVLLEIYLGQPRAAEAVELLAQPVRVSSWLIVVEVPVVLRRVLDPVREAALLATALDRFDRDARSMSLVDGFPAVAQRVRSDPRLAGCRSLDAIHAATALVVQESTGHPVRLLTFDARLEAVAVRLGLAG